MILSNEELIKLKVLILGALDEEDNNNCMKCTPKAPCCGLISACNRYDSFNFIGGANDMVMDLFDTIENLKDDLFEKRIIDNCLNCDNHDGTWNNNCILDKAQELNCLTNNFDYHIRRSK